MARETAAFASPPPKRAESDGDWKSFSFAGGESRSMISPKVAIDFILTPDPERNGLYLPQFEYNSKGLTILQFWFKLMIMRNQSFMARRSFLFSACLIFLAAGPLGSAVKQGRGTVERASTQT